MRTKSLLPAACCLAALLLRSESPAGQPAEAVAPLSAEAQAAFDVGSSLAEEAFVSGKPEDWDAAVDALMKAHELAPAYAPIALRLAAAHQQRKRFLSAVAWGYAYLYADAKQEFAKNAREVVEYCSRRAEAQKIKIFATARSLAGKIPAGRGGPPGLFQTAVTMGDEWEWYDWQRAKSAAHPREFDTCDLRKGLLEDVRCLQAEAGDFQAVIDEAALFLAECPPDFRLLPSRFESPCWDAFFRSALETKNWAGALEALRWDYAALDVPEERRQALRRWGADTDNCYHDRAKNKWQELAFPYGMDPGHSLTKPRIVEAWTSLAVQLAAAEQELRVEDRVQELQKKAENKQGDPQKIPLQLAELAVPLGKGLQKIHALQQASDGALITAAIRSAYAPAPAGPPALEAALADNPQLLRARGFWDATALHAAAIGSQAGTCPIYKLSRMDLSIEGDNKYFHLDMMPVRDAGLAEAPRAKRIVEILLSSGADVNAQMANGWTPLHAAAAGYSRDLQAVPIVQLLLAKGGDVNACDKHGLTPLHLAAGFGNLQTVACLLSKGADAKAATSRGRTPLYEAAGGWTPGEERIRMFALLLAHGADVNTSDDDGKTPLHFAAGYGQTAVVEYLLTKDAGVNAATERTRETPLHLAARGGHTEVVKRLIDAGADISAKSRDGETAADLAARRGYAELSSYLRGVMTR
jgi:ankyrin repeat protein